MYWLSLLLFGGQIYCISTVSFFLVSSLELLFTGAYEALFPSIVGEKHLLTANSFQNLAENLSIVLGPILAGIGVKALGVKTAFLMDGFTFLFSAFCIISMRDYFKNIQTTKRESSYIQDLKEGIKYSFNTKGVKFILIMGVLSMLGFGGYSALLVVYAKDVLKTGVTGYGLLYAANGIGSIVGALILGLFAYSITIKKGKGIALSMTIISITTLFFALANSLRVALFILLIEGIFVALSQVSQETVLQEIVPIDLRGRVFLSLTSVTNIAMIISMVIAGTISDLLGIRSVFLIAAGLCFISSCVGWLKLKEIV